MTAWALEQHDGLPSVTQKLEIGGVDCYLTVAWGSAAPVFWQMVISGGKNKNPLIEIALGHALRLLETGGSDLRGIVREWSGTRFEPAGVCPQLGGIVTSPLDAAARWLARRLPE